jgi:hypothetical protein
MPWERHALPDIEPLVAGHLQDRDIDMIAHVHRPLPVVVLLAYRSSQQKGQPLRAGPSITNAPVSI